MQSLTMWLLCGFLCSLLCFEHACKCVCACVCVCVCRDMKPSNVLIAERRGGVAAVVADLGLSRRIRTDRTAHTAPVGTAGQPCCLAWLLAVWIDAGFVLFWFGLVWFGCHLCCWGYIFASHQYIAASCRMACPRDSKLCYGRSDCNQVVCGHLFRWPNSCFSLRSDAQSQGAGVSCPFIVCLGCCCASIAFGGGVGACGRLSGCMLHVHGCTHVLYCPCLFVCLPVLHVLCLYNSWLRILSCVLTLIRTALLCKTSACDRLCYSPTFFLLLFYFV